MTKFSRQARQYVSEETIQKGLLAAATPQPKPSMFKLWLRALWLEFKLKNLISKTLRRRAYILRKQNEFVKATKELTVILNNLRKTIDESKSVHQARYPKVPPADTGGD